MDNRVRLCQNCGQEIFGGKRYKNRRYCTRECIDEARKKNKDPIKKTKPDHVGFPTVDDIINWIDANYDVRRMTEAATREAIEQFSETENRPLSPQLIKSALREIGIIANDLRDGLEYRIMMDDEE